MSRDLDDRLHAAGQHYRAHVHQPPAVQGRDLPSVHPTSNRSRRVAAVAAAALLVVVCSVAAVAWKHHRSASTPPASAVGLYDTTWYQQPRDGFGSGVLRLDNGHYSLRWGCNSRTGALSVRGSRLTFTSPENAKKNACGQTPADQQMDEVTSNGSSRWSLNGAMLTLTRGSTSVTLRNDTLVQGTLLVSGGPCCSPNRGVAGRIEIAAGAEHTGKPIRTVDTGPSGGFIVHLKAGTYVFTGRWNDTICHTDGAVHVSGASTQVTVVCAIP